MHLQHWSSGPLCTRWRLRKEDLRNLSVGFGRWKYDTMFYDRKWGRKHPNDSGKPGRMNHNKKCLPVDETKGCTWVFSCLLSSHWEPLAFIAKISFNGFTPAQRPRGSNVWNPPVAVESKMMPGIEGLDFWRLPPSTFLHQMLPRKSTADVCRFHGGKMPSENFCTWQDGRHVTITCDILHFWISFKLCYESGFHPHL